MRKKKKKRRGNLRICRIRSHYVKVVATCCGDPKLRKPDWSGGAEKTSMTECTCLNIIADALD
jgi:hypothetical protein